ncbi:MAG: hypothetical protein WC661_12090 [Opitutaceae bacterium]|jgi:hypothetical protein
MKIISIAIRGILILLGSTGLAFTPLMLIAAMMSGFADSDAERFRIYLYCILLPVGSLALIAISFLFHKSPSDENEN